MICGEFEQEHLNIRQNSNIRCFFVKKTFDFDKKRQTKNKNCCTIYEQSTFL